MKGNREDKLGRYYSVETACDQHFTAWQNLSAFLTGATRTKSIIQRTATGTLKAVFKEADTVLNAWMDKLLPILAKDHLGFIADYENVRIIVDLDGENKTK